MLIMLYAGESSFYCKLLINKEPAQVFFSFAQPQDDLIILKHFDLK